MTDLEKNFPFGPVDINFEFKKDHVLIWTCTNHAQELTTIDFLAVLDDLAKAAKTAKG